jgi:hypothetical protein
MKKMKKFPIVKKIMKKKTVLKGINHKKKKVIKFTKELIHKNKKTEINKETENIKIRIGFKETKIDTTYKKREIKEGKTIQR